MPQELRQKCWKRNESTPKRITDGALVARYVGMAMGWYTEDQAAGWVASLVGAVVLLFIYGMIKGRSTGSRNAKGAVLLKQSAH